jgi:alpha-tubulin suppressor-like RCC1 family protein/PKD repeat protein
MRNRKMLLSSVLFVVLVLSLISPACVPSSDSVADSGVGKGTALFAIPLNTDAGNVTPMVAAGYDHTVGLKSDGTVVAVGDNSYGQCNVASWTDMIQVAAGQFHTVGLKSNGTVVAVGANSSGRCDVGNWTDIIQVAAGYQHTVGLESDGTVVAVGDNSYGECNVGGWTDIVQVAVGSGGWNTVGLKSDGTVVAVGLGVGVVGVGAWTDIIQVAAGAYHTVGLKSDGTVVAVGDNSYGQCNVGGWTGIIQVSAGYDHTVGLKSDGTMVAVGDNYYGECDVGNSADMIQISAGGYHTVGLKSDSTAIAVGYDYYGQCSVGNWADVVQVSAGDDHTVGLKSDGTVAALGYNYYGQCDVGNWTDIAYVAAGGYYERWGTSAGTSGAYTWDDTVGLKSDGTVVAVGVNWYGQCDVGTWTDIIQVALGGFHTVGLKSDGTVVAVGSNNAGECNVGGWTDIIQVAAGEFHTVGLKSNGTVVAAGDNGAGYCDVGSWTDIVQVAAGLYDTVGLKSDGTVVAVGANTSGQCDVGRWTDIVQVSAGYDHTVGLKSDGTVVAVGANGYGQCNVGNWTDIIQVSAGLYDTVGLKSDGTVVAAGPEVELAKWHLRNAAPHDTTLPTVSTVSPEDGAASVPVDTNVTATFSEAMNGSTITAESFTLAGSAASGTVTYDPATFTATFTPDAALAYNHMYTATLSTNITDLAGNPLAASYVWSFTTESAFVVDFSAQPTDGYAPLAVQFTDMSTGVFTSWEWDFNGDGIVDSTDENPIHEFGSGTYTVSLTAHGPDGSNIRTKTNYIVAESPTSSQLPTGMFVYSPSAPRAGEEVMLDASKSNDPNGNIEYYEWDLNGDGNYDGFTTSPIIYYSWTSPGTYHVSIRVCGANGLKATYAEDIHVADRSLWEKIKSLFSSNVKSLSQGDWNKFQLIKSELHISNWPQSSDPSSDPDFYWIDDNQLLTVLKEAINPTDSPMTYETYILDQLHDMKLADSVAGRSFDVDPVINVYFNSMATMNAWVEGTSMLGKDSLAGTIELEGGTGIGVGAVFALWDVAQAGVGLEFLDQTFYKRALWYYFYNRDNYESPQEAFDLSPVPLKYQNQATRNYFEKLWTEYGDSNIAAGGGLKDSFKEQVIEQLRSLLLTGCEKYKFAPYQIYEVHSPGELRVYDSAGRVTGVVNGTVREEIPNSAYDEETKTVLIYPAADVYYCQFVGTEQGTYGLTVMDIQGGESTTFDATQIATANRTIHKYGIDWATLSQGKKGVTVYVDSNGDGITDYSFKAGNVLTGNEFVPPSACFIATAAYGTPMASEVQTLRDFRDQYMLTNPLGQALVNLYYETSPPIASFITDHPSLKPIVRAWLAPIVAVSAVAVNTSPTEKVAVLAFLVLVSVAMALWMIRRRGKHPGLA